MDSKAQKTQVEKINMEQNQHPLNQSDEESLKAECSKKLATNGVFFQCPMIDCLETLPQEEWPDIIEEFIKEQIDDDPCLQSVLLIKNCNTDESEVETCISLLLFYINNIIFNIDLKMNRKIKIMSKMFMEHISPMKGAIEFLTSVGFEKKKQLIEGQEEEIMVLEDSPNMLDVLENGVEYLKSTENIKLVLDRDIQVLQPTTAFEKQLLPSEFFLTSNETEELESQIVLKTQNLNIKEENSSKISYKYCLVRVKFPDNLTLQGTFDINEQLSNVLNFVKESIFDEEQTFKLKLIDGRTVGYKDKNKILSELDLEQTAIIQFTFDPLCTYFEYDQAHPFLKVELLSSLE